MDDAFFLGPNETIDTDRDGIGNNANLDDDNGGTSDINEIASGRNPLLNEGAIIPVIVPVLLEEEAADVNMLSPCNPGRARQWSGLTPWHDARPPAPQ